MAEKKVEDYIRKLLKAGYGKTAIKEQLVKAGYEENQIAPLIETAQEQLYPKDTVKRGHFGIGVSIVILFIAGALYVLTEKGESGCIDISCLTTAANACLPAQYYEDIEGTKILYEIKGCILTKKITSFGPKEPPELQEVLAGKSLECPYTQGQFDQEWAGVFGGLEKCKGPLKDAIYELRFAQESLK